MKNLLLFFIVIFSSCTIKKVEPKKDIKQMYLKICAGGQLFCHNETNHLGFCVEDDQLFLLFNQR